MNRTQSSSRLFAVAVLLLAGGVGCARLGNQDAAVQRAIEEHLSQRSDLAMDKMVLEMQQVSVEGDRAQAEVVFRTTMEPPARMAYHYDLRREGSRWRVESGRPSATEAPHPQMGDQMGESPGASPGELTDESDPLAGESNMMGELPEGHPPLEGSNPDGEMPASPH